MSGQGRVDGSGFTLCWLQSAGNGSLVADAEKTRNFLLLFQIKNPALGVLVLVGFFFLNPSPEMKNSGQGADFTH